MIINSCVLMLVSAHVGLYKWTEHALNLDVRRSLHNQQSVYRSRHYFKAIQCSIGNASRSGSTETPERAVSPCCRAQDPARRAAALQELLAEIGATIQASGPRGAQRAFQAAAALLSVSREYFAGLQRGRQDPPQVPCLVGMFVGLGMVSATRTADKQLRKRQWTASSFGVQRGPATGPCLVEISAL